jgi:hypothetical protein
MLVYLILFSLVAGTACCENTLLDETMTPKDREATGVNRLNSQQKRALERWLENWTRTVITHAPSYHPSQSLTQWMSNWRQEQHINKVIEEENPEAAVHTLFRNTNGATLELANGSIWTINVIDQYTASFWKRGDKITISPNNLDITRPFTLYDTSRGEAVGASLQRPASPNGKRPQEPPSYYEGSHSITTLGMNGSSITLDNGRTYSISPLDQLQVSQSWQLSDRIRVTKNNDTTYPAKLNNLDSGGQAAGIEIR